MASKDFSPVAALSRERMWFSAAALGASSAAPTESKSESESSFARGDRLEGNEAFFAVVAVGIITRSGSQSSALLQAPKSSFSTNRRQAGLDLARVLAFWGSGSFFLLRFPKQERRRAVVVEAALLVVMMRAGARPEPTTVSSQSLSLFCRSQGTVVSLLA